MQHKIKISCLALFILLITVSCDNKQIKNVDEQTDSTAVSDTIPIEKRDHFLFVGMYYGKPGLLIYNIQKQKYDPLFAVQKESVISLNYNRDLSSIFFLTAGKSGTRGGLPFVNKIKFYRVNPKNLAVEMIKDFGNGSQLLAQWNDDGNYEVIITSIDKTISSYFNVDKRFYNTFGRLIDEKTETYDIINDGYPSLIPNRSATVSPSGKHGIAVEGDSIFLKSAGEDNLQFMAQTNFEINKVSWSNDEDFLFFSTITPDSESVNMQKQSELFVYSINGDSLVSKWEGTGVKNYITFNNLLVFDDGLNYQSFISIYNYKQNELVKTIRIRGGCGIVNIPR
jgi:hypothetical protein